MAGISVTTTLTNRAWKEKLKQLQPAPREALKALFPDLESVSNTGLTVAKANHLTEELPNKYLDLCKFILRKIKLWDGECSHGESRVDKSLIEEVKDVLEGNLTISFVGGYNKGKSTLLNALLEDDILPTSKKSETAVKVYIQHKEDCHEGCCSKGGNCEKCPTMCNYVGKSQIKEKLHSLNSEQMKTENSEGVKTEERVVLHANVPVLRPSSLTKGTQMQISLVDIPGMGVTDEAISKMATECTQSSCAYVYVMDYNYLEKAEDSENLKMLYEKEMKHCHLIVAANKFDTLYEPEIEVGSNFKDEIAQVKEDVCQTLKKVLPWELPKDSVVPVSGKLALQAALYDSLEKDHLAYTAKNIEQVVDFPCGEGESPPPVPTVLREGSNIEELSKRIERMADDLSVGWVAELKTRVMVLLQTLQGWYLKVTIKWTCGMKELQDVHEEYIRKGQEMDSAMERLKREAVKAKLERAFVIDLNVEEVRHQIKEKLMQLKAKINKSKGCYNFSISEGLKGIVTSISHEIGDCYKETVYQSISDTYYKSTIRGLMEDIAELEKKVSAFCNCSYSNRANDLKSLVSKVKDLPNPEFLSAIQKAGFLVDKPGLFAKIGAVLRHHFAKITKKYVKHDAEQHENTEQSIPDPANQQRGASGPPNQPETGASGLPNQQETGASGPSNWKETGASGLQEAGAKCDSATPIKCKWLSTEEADAALNDIGKDLLAQTVEYVDVVKQTVVNHYWDLYEEEVKICLKRYYNPYKCAIAAKREELKEMEKLLEILNSQLKEIELRIQNIELLVKATASTAAKLCDPQDTSVD